MDRKVAVDDRNMAKDARANEKTFVKEIVTAVSLTSAVVASFTPGYKFVIKRVRSFCRTKAGTVTAVIKVGGRTAVTVTFTAATDLAQTLSSTLANIRGSGTEAITIELTTDGTGALTNAHLAITIRPRPLAGEAVAGGSKP